METEEENYKSELKSQRSLYSREKRLEEKKDGNSVSDCCGAETILGLFCGKCKQHCGLAER